jgi:predicted N-acetyltransferase YhbS
MIRPADLNDREEIWTMLREYREASPLNAHNNVDETTAKAMVEAIIEHRRGLILLTVKDNIITGMIMAIYTFNIWDQNIRYMAELAYWVKPEYRGSRDGYRLIKEYKSVGDLLIQQKEIQYYTISKMVTSPDLNYERFGFEKLEETYICQAH